MKEKIEAILEDMWERPFTRTWEAEEKNMRKILEKHLSEDESTGDKLTPNENEEWKQWSWTNMYTKESNDGNTVQDIKYT